MHWFIATKELFLQKIFTLLSRTDVDCEFVCLEIKIFKSSSFIFSITYVNLLCEIIYKT